MLFIGSRSSYLKKQKTSLSLSNLLRYLKPSGTWFSLDGVAQAGKTGGYPPVSSGICRYLQMSATQYQNIYQSYDITESLQAPPDTHEVSRLPQNLAYKAQVCLTLAWAGQTERLLALCRPTWPPAKAGELVVMY